MTLEEKEKTILDILDKIYQCERRKEPLDDFWMLCKIDLLLSEYHSIISEQISKKHTVKL